MSENDTPQNAGYPTPNYPPQVPEYTQMPPVGGAPVSPPPTYQVPPQQNYVPPQNQGGYKTRSMGIGSVRKEKWTAVVLAFVLGTLGIHKFYLGYKSEGLAMLLITVLGACIAVGPMIMGIFAIIEAVKYVTLTEEDFQATYVDGYKGWF